MSRYPSIAAEMASGAPRAGRLPGVHALVALLILVGLLAGTALLVHWSVGGAAPAAALSVIGETFDKGF